MAAVYARNMPEEGPIRLGLTNTNPQQLPAADSLQFRRAEKLPDQNAPDTGAQLCKSCQQPIAEDYYRVREHVICPACTQRMQVGLQAPPAHTLLRSALYGAGAALAGCALYALVAIVLNLEIGIVAVVIGYMVGKAVRYGSRGLGGRPQQILAVALTYFGITFSFIPVFIYTVYHNPKLVEQAAQSQQDQTPGQTAEQPGAGAPRERMTVAHALLAIAGLALAAPFITLFHNPVSGGISLLILFIGLQQAWILTRRPDLKIVGPFKMSQA